MGFLSDLGGAILSGAKSWNDEAMEYYNRAMDMSDDRLRKEFQRARENPSNKARLAGYAKAAQERGLA